MGCIRHNSAGLPYEEISCLHPSIGKFYMNWEFKYDPVPVRDWMVAHPTIPIIAVVLYCAFIVLGRTFFKDRKAWSFRKILACWNFSLSLFSFVGLFRTLPHLVHNLTSYSMHENLCNDPESQYGSGTTGLWIQLFILSKFPELIDTFFIVVHKKPLIFLHWYHHITVLLYCWHSYVTKAPAGIFFCVMNYAVHAIMYGYYFLMAIKMKPKWMNAMVITSAQISQMVVGVFVTLLGFYYYEHDMDSVDNPCFIKHENNVAAFLMYGSYLFLFLQFFIGRYYTAKISRKASSDKKQH